MIRCLILGLIAATVTYLITGNSLVVAAIFFGFVIGVLIRND